MFFFLQVEVLHPAGAQNKIQNDERKVSSCYSLFYVSISHCRAVCAVRIICLCLEEDLKKKIFCSTWKKL